MSERRKRIINFLVGWTLLGTLIFYIREGNPSSVCHTSSSCKSKKSYHIHMHLPVLRFFFYFFWKEHLKINQCENLWKCSLWQRSGFPSDCVSCWMWLQGAVWQGVVCRTNTQPQLICQDVQGFITFSQREDFNGAINDLVSRHNGNKQIDPTYDLLYHSEVSDFSDMKESLSMRMRGVPVWKCKPCQTCWAER